MNRKWIYYVLTMIMGCASVGGALNSQLILVGKNQAWSGAAGWEIIFGGYGALIYALGCLYLAFLSDKLGRLPCIALCCIIGALTNVAMGLKVFGEYRLWHFFLYWFVMNIVFAVFFTGVEGLLSDYQDHSVPLAKRLGAYCVAWSIGDTALSVSTGNVKQLTGGGEMIYNIIGALCIIAFIAIVWDWAVHGYKKLGETDIGVADIRAHAPFHATLGRIGLFFSSMAYTCAVCSFPRFGRDYHKLSEGAIGNLIGIILFSALVTFILFPRWLGWHYRPRLQILLQSPMALGIFIAIAAPAHSVTALTIGFSLFGIGWSISYFFSIYYSLMVVTGHAESGGVHEAFLGIGNMMGPIIAVFVIWAVGKTDFMHVNRIAVIALYVAFFSIAVSLLIQIILVERKNRLSKPQLIKN